MRVFAYLMTGILVYGSAGWHTDLHRDGYNRWWKDKVQGYKGRNRGKYPGVDDFKEWKREISQLFGFFQ